MWYSDYLPVSDSSSYDNTAKAYQVRRILTKDFTLDLEKYKEYSPIFLSTTFALQYGLSFASIISVVMHTGLFHGKEVWMRIRHSRSEPKDIHNKLYSTYKEVPQWWFMVMFAIMIAMGFTTCLAWETKLTWWGYVIAIIISAAWMVR